MSFISCFFINILEDKSLKSNITQCGYIIEMLYLISYIELSTFILYMLFPNFMIHSTIYLTDMRENLHYGG